MTTTSIATCDRLLMGSRSQPGHRSQSGHPPPGSFAEHVATHGNLAIPAGDDPPWRAGMVRAVTESGLLGRGGAGFPPVRKWKAMDRTARRPVVVVNAMEGEPASGKDRVLLTHAPHLVLDGADVVAAVIGASDIVVCVADHGGPNPATLKAAVDQRTRSGATRSVTVEYPPGRYVTGEESALVGWLNSRQAVPIWRPDKSVPLQLARRPTVVHNAETLAQLALIARHGPEWFRRVGTSEAPGTTLVTVTGAVVTPGVVEVELGTPVTDILSRAGGHRELSAVLLGGYGGAWVDAGRLAVPYAPGPLTAAGATHGVGVVVALPVTSCGIVETARVARYMAGESAGQCGPCIFGLPALADELERLASGHAGVTVLDRLDELAATIDGRGACRHPDGVVRLVRSALAVFADDAWAHAQGRPCPGHDRPSVLTFPRGPAAGARRVS